MALNLKSATTVALLKGYSCSSCFWEKAWKNSCNLDHLICPLYVEAGAEHSDVSFYGLQQIDKAAKRSYN